MILKMGFLTNRNMKLSNNNENQETIVKKPLKIILPGIKAIQHTFTPFQGILSWKW